MRFKLLILLTTLPFFLKGQVLEHADFDSIIQDLLPQQEYDVDYSDLYDRLFSLYASPMDLNQAEREDFNSVFFLGEAQISAIIQYREKFGPFITFYELLSIEGFDRNLVEKMQRFFRIDNEGRETLSNAVKNPSVNDFILRYQSVLEEKVGYTPADTLSNGRLTSRYAGDPSRLFARYQYAKNGYYSLGFTIEKDPGEKITWDPATKRYGMDYYSFHLMLENVGVIRRVIIGDFSMDFGQGLVFASGIRYGKGAEPITTIRRNNLGLRPYRSAYESKDYSGLAVSSGFGKIDLTMFVSDVKRDSRISTFQNDAMESIQFISSINHVGLHRTPTEIQSKHSLSDKSVGANLNFHLINKRLNVGFNSVFNRYSLPVFQDETKYKAFRFRGRENINSSLYVNYYFKNGHLFSEFAMSKSGGMAHATGVIFSLSSMLQTSLHFRSYDPDYHTFNGNAFGENTSTGNEKGIYWGIRLNPISRLIITTYLDYFHFPWLKYRVDAPSGGIDFMVNAQYFLNDRARLSVRFREKEYEMNHTVAGSPITAIEKKKITRFLFELENEIDDNWSLKSSIHTNTSSFGAVNGDGFLIAQDLLYKSKKWSIAVRFSIFDTDNYDSRVFIYERDMLYVFAVPSFYNSGLRYYLNARYNISRRMSCWLKFAQTSYSNIEAIGSGLERINGNKRSNVGVQLRIRL